MKLAELEEIREKLLTQTSYLDVLALSMALCKSNEFTNNRAAWSRVLLRFRVNMEHQHHPEVRQLFEGIWFDMRDKGNPYSEQIESFFVTMGRSGCLVCPSPAMNVYQMPFEAKKDIIEKEVTHLSKYVLLHSRISPRN